MRNIGDGTKIVPHPEEAAKRPSRRTHGIGAASCQLISSLDAEWRAAPRKKNECVFVTAYESFLLGPAPTLIWRSAEMASVICWNSQDQTSSTGLRRDV